MVNEVHILVVEDDSYLRTATAQMLQQAGYRVAEAANGAEALELLAQRPIDLILADIAMPVMNGYQLFQQVTSEPRWVGIPFIFLSARAMDSDVRYGKELGADDYLTKPFRLEDLLAAVAGSLRRAQRRGRTRAGNGYVPGAPADRWILGSLQVDPTSHGVWLGSERIELSAREFRLLQRLAQEPAVVVPMEDIVRATHQLTTDFAEASSLLRPLVRTLRRKLGFQAGDMGCIHNLRGVGYMLIPPGEGDPRASQ
jgi:DNA-binding response OmpR family regulator